MATDPSFAEHLRTDPAAVAADFDLDAADLAALESLRADSTQGEVPILRPRLSKSSLFFGHPHSSSLVAKESVAVPSADVSTPGLTGMDSDSLVELTMSQCSQDTTNTLHTIVGQLQATMHEHDEVHSFDSLQDAAESDAKDQLAIDPVATATFFPIPSPGGSS